MQHIIKAVKTRGFSRTSTSFPCPHFTVLETPDFFELQIPVQDGDRTNIRHVRLPDDYDAFYHMNSEGDTVDSWVWDKRSNKLNPRKHEVRGG